MEVSMRKLWSRIGKIVAIAVTMCSLASLPAAAQDNVKIVQSLYDAFGRGDIGRIVDAAAPDVKWELIGRKQDCPCAGKFTGKAGVSDFFKVVDQTWDFKQFAPREFLPSGDSVVALGSYEMVHKGTGKPFQAEWVHVFTFKEGKLMSFREFTDTASMAEANRM